MRKSNLRYPMYNRGLFDISANVYIKNAYNYKYKGKQEKTTWTKCTFN